MPIYKNKYQTIKKIFFYKIYTFIINSNRFMILF